MDRIVGISDRANAAMHTLALAAARGGSITAAAAAEELLVSPSYLGKVLQSLAKRGLLVSSRGAAGGFALARDPSLLRCAEVLECLDGPLPERACLFEAAVCQRGKCAFSAFCADTTKRLAALLEATTIADLAACFVPRRAVGNAAR